MRADVAIIGAGIIGCAAARGLAREGRSVIVLDPDGPGTHASFAAAGMLAPQAESDSLDPLLPLLLAGRAVYPEYVAELEGETGIQVGYASAGMLVLALDLRDREQIAERFEWQSSFGLEVEQLSAEEARRLEPAISSEVTSALRFRGDHSVDNRLLTGALHLASERAGVHFLAEEALRIETGGAAGSAVVTSGGTRIDAARVVLAAGSWSGRIGGLPRPVPVEPVHGELICYRAPGLVRHTIATHGSYLVPRGDGRLIAGATASRIGFTATTTDAGRALVKERAEMLVPALADLEIVDHWSGLRPGTPDDFPILGADPDHPSLIYATGHYRNGILLAPITASIVADLVAGRAPSVDISPFGIERFEG